MDILQTLDDRNNMGDSTFKRVCHRSSAAVSGREYHVAMWLAYVKTGSDVRNCRGLSMYNSRAFKHQPTTVLV